MSRARPFDDDDDPLDPKNFDYAYDFEYSIRVECPLCGARVGVVEKHQSRPERVVDDLAGHSHADAVAWPPRLLLDREIAKVMRRPAPVDGTPDASKYNGRGGRVRARLVAQTN